MIARPCRKRQTAKSDATLVDNGGVTQNVKPMSV